jgi:hypothetical protein
MSDKTSPNTLIICITAAAHASYLFALFIVCLCLCGVVLFWMLGSPVILDHPPARIYRFAGVQIVFFGVVALITHFVGERLQKQITGTRTPRIDNPR